MPCGRKMAVCAQHKVATMLDKGGKDERIDRRDAKPVAVASSAFGYSLIHTDEAGMIETANLIDESACRVALATLEVIDEELTNGKSGHDKLFAS